MTKNDFAIKNGFESYEEMLSNSSTIIYDHGTLWLVSSINKGWLAWIDDPEQELGTFETFEKAQERLIYTFAEKELEQSQVKEFKH